MAWSDDIPNRTILYSINALATLLSLAGSLWMTYFCMKTSSRTLSPKLILGIAVSDLLYSIANVMSIFEDKDGEVVDDMCRIEAVIRFYSLKLTLFFSMLITILCYVALRKGNINSKSFIKKSVVGGVLFFGALTLG